MKTKNWLLDLMCCSFFLECYLRCSHSWQVNKSSSLYSKVIFLMMLAMATHPIKNVNSLSQLLVFPFLALFFLPSIWPLCNRLNVLLTVYFPHWNKPIQGCGSILFTAVSLAPRTVPGTQWALSTQKLLIDWINKSINHYIRSRSFTKLAFLSF